MGDEAPPDMFTKAPEVKVVEPKKEDTASNSVATTEVEAQRSVSQDIPMSPRNYENPFSRQQTSLDMDDYFVGPRDTRKHSKWPMFMQMHGSILPKMILPLTFVGAWSTVITCISQLKYSLGISSLLLTVLGFVVGLSLSFRSSTAYERYSEGRKYWSQLILASQNLARVIWIHSNEREGQQGKEDLLRKITGLNLLVAYSVALKHKLRFEPYTSYDDLKGLVGHLDTLAKTATTPEATAPKRKSVLKAGGEYLGVSFAESNPRKVVKNAKRPVGNLPLEILSYLSAFVDTIIEEGLLKIPMQQTIAYNNLGLLNDVLTGTDRILSTPLPVAYSIAISQITWVYIMLLPFQLFDQLGWITIPGSIIAAYIILGLLLIGREIENPFGNDVNDLPLDHFCQQLATEIDIISSMRKPSVNDWMKSDNNQIMFPISSSGYSQWSHRTERLIREELKFKTEIGFETRKSMQATRAEEKKGAERV